MKGTFISFFIYLRDKHRHKEGVWGTGAGLFCLLGHSSNAHGSWGWSPLKSGARKSLGFHAGGRDPTTQVVACVQQEEAKLGAELGFKLSD